MKKLVLFLLFTSTGLSQESYLLQINRLSLPIDNKGVLADVSINGKAEDGKLDSIGFLFSAGFFLSGKNNNAVWANAMATSSRIADYQPGNVGSTPYDPRYAVYTLRKGYPLSPYEPFGLSWQKWRYAVEYGADFYDGDGDSIYNPVDLNGDGKWNSNEDAPDLIGDITAWCVYNDGVPSIDRAFQDEEPLGIEIQQTVFAFYDDYPYNNFDARSSTFFVRYKIINTGSVADTFDSVYFGGWADTDLGGANGYGDDLAGCDTLQNSGYVYNDGYDPSFGVNPPAHFVKILQGPYKYIPGETFLDNNTNGEYDEGIDTPLDTAFNFKGEFSGVDTLSGAKNIGMTSFVNYMKSKPIHGDPDDIYQFRNYLKGLESDGNVYNPCSFPYGEVIGGVNCNDINPAYMYSGDPVTQSGWIDIAPWDQRQLVSTGPFTLKTGKPVTIIVAHIVGRGTDSLNSITVSREFSKAIEDFYKTNFTDFVVSVEDGKKEYVPTSFQLYQNYPNPFNPTTNIGFTISDFGLITLKVYDVLGKEVATLVNEDKSAGNYEVEFDASSLPSGVYLYQLQAGDYIKTNKMILLK